MGESDREATDPAGADTAKPKQALIVWQLFYALSLCLVKSSICVTLMRIATERKYLIILKTLVIFSFLLSGIGIVVLFNQCHPLDSYWDPRIPGVCIPGVYITVLSVAASVVNVLTDFAVATIPFFLLRDVQMRPRVKFYIRAILAMGLLYVHISKPNPSRHWSKWGVVTVFFFRLSCN